MARQVGRRAARFRLRGAAVGGRGIGYWGSTRSVAYRMADLQFAFRLTEFLEWQRMSPFGPVGRARGLVGKRRATKPQ